MRKIIMLNRVSVDGYFAGPQGELDWFEHEPEVGEEWHNIGSGADTIIFGGTTYKVFEDIWPKFRNDPNLPKEIKAIAEELDQMNKLVFSRSLEEASWENSRLFRGNLACEVRKLRKKREATS
jgi:dihydrofolate reductase